MEQDPALLEFRRAAVRARYEHYAEAARIRSRVVADLSFVGLKIMPLLSGGAILALFTLVAGGQFKPNHAWLIGSMAAFVGSIVAWMVTVILGYLSQNEIMMKENLIAEQLFAELVGAPQQLVDDAALKASNAKLKRAIVACALSVALFALGAVLAFVSVLVMP